MDNLGNLMSALRSTALLLTVTFAAVIAQPACAHREFRTGGKLLLTGGVTSVDGAAGGGLATWAVIAGNETRDGIGGGANISYVPLADMSLLTYGAKIGVYDRLELSYQHQAFDTHKFGEALGLGRGYTFHQDIFGAKLRVAGDAVYAQDSILPQLSTGIQFHHADRGAIIHAVGGAHADGTDFYVAATKLLLNESLVLNGTVRATKANQFGLLGFGGDRHRGYTAQFEGSAGYLLTRKLVVGAELRSKPDNLRFAQEQVAYDLFAAYAICHQAALTLGYVNLGSIATARAQRGAFLSLQSSF